LELKKKLYDNYNEVLPVVLYGKKTDAQSMNPYMDKAIEKASIVIQQHSMKFNGKEYVKWIDDSYMLIGKAYFYKQEYVSARRTFGFVENEYPENDIKYSAQAWLARTYNQLGQYEKAEPLLNQLKEEAANGKVPLEVKKEIPLILANTYILQGNYQKAVAPLYDGIKINSDRDLVTRLKFILAQIQQLEGNLNEATKLYLEVVKRNPPYEMAFQSKINLAKSYEAQSGNSGQIFKTLKKMLKDSKNKEFKDQIYYALAEVSFKDQQDSSGIIYLRLSVATSKKNAFQKTTSSLALAEIYFDKSVYKLSGAYYDTAMQSIPDDFPDYEKIKERADILGELIVNLKTVQREDSLQYLAGLPEEERLVIIDKIIENYIAEEERQKEEERLKQQYLANQGGTGFDNGSAGGKWYFYNTGTKSQGFNEFQKRWGSRQLEDLWRLSNKTVFAFEEIAKNVKPADSLAGDSATGMKSTDPRSRQFYLQDIPFTTDQIKESNLKLAEAFFNLGKLYKEGLGDYPKSRESYETLLNRFPENDYLLQAYYDLYKIFERDNNQEMTSYYKNLIVENYPESDYAKVILNPDYFKELAENKNEAQKLYEKTYEAYKSEQYLLVINYADMAMKNGADTALLPKFEYLRAISLGKVEVLDTLVVALKNIIRNYPKSEVTPLAENILAAIYTENAALVSEPDKEINELINSPYEFRPEEPHFFAIAANRDSVNVSALKVRLSDFDKDYFSLRKLNINSIVLDQKRYLVTVGNFANMEDAMNYYNLITEDVYVFGNMKRTYYQVFALSSNNYPVLFNNKNTLDYLKFFEKYYLTNE